MRWVGLVPAAALVLFSTTLSRAQDVYLGGNQHLDVVSSYRWGYLYDSSTASILPGGSFHRLNSSGTSIVSVAGGSISEVLASDDYSSVSVTNGNVGVLVVRASGTIKVSDGNVGSLVVYDNADVSITGGSITSLAAYDSGTVRISGARLHDLETYVNSVTWFAGGSLSQGVLLYGNSTLHVSDGNIGGLWGSCGVTGSSSIYITGGSVTPPLRLYDGSTADVAGGNIVEVVTYDSSTITFHGYDFQMSNGLSLDGNEVRGSGVLSGNWFDGTEWATTIVNNGGTIRVIPEPAMISILVSWGALVLTTRRSRSVLQSPHR